MFNFRNKNNNNLYKLENFFYLDLEIKKLLNATAPDIKDLTDKDSVFEYGTNLEKVLETTESFLEKIITSFNLDIDLKDLETILKYLQTKLLNTNYDYSSLVNFYKTYIMKFDPKYAYLVREKLHGYGDSDNYLNEVFFKATSINEMLHALHFYIINNENILKSMPVLSKGKTKGNYPITLYGNNLDIAKSIFNSLKKSERIGNTDIVVLKDKILFMIRDCGHATQIEVSFQDDNCLVNYYFPKVCNLSIVNNLKGVNKVNDISSFVTGAFNCKKDELVFELTDFIEKIPTDLEMDMNNLDSKTI